MCNHTSRVGDNCGESCADCGEKLRGFGYGGWFSSNLTGWETSKECIHNWVSIGEGDLEVCIYCESFRKKPKTETENK